MDCSCWENSLCMKFKVAQSEWPTGKHMLTCYLLLFYSFFFFPFFLDKGPKKPWMAWDGEWVGTSSFLTSPC